MKILSITGIALTSLGLGCAGSYPPPTQQMADVQSANRSATELGAQNNPKAQLHLKLAEEQLNQAKKARAADDNQSAESLLMRAKADAELAVALTRADSAKVGANNATEQANVQRATNAETGAHQ